MTSRLSRSHHDLDTEKVFTNSFLCDNTEGVTYRIRYPSVLSHKGCQKKIKNKI